MRATPTQRRMLGTLVSSALLVAVAALALVMVVIPMALHAMPFTVLTASMDPTMPAGSLVVTRPVPVEQVEIGDVVTYQIKSGEPDVVTHRVIGVGWDAQGDPVFVTKGDANALADAPIKAAQVRGVVAYHVPYLGFVNTWVGVNRPAWLAPAAAGCLFVYALVMVVGAARDRVRRRTEPKELSMTGAVAP